MNWRTVWTSGVVERLGESCSTLQELAIALSQELGEVVSADAIGSSNRRLRQELGLRAPSEYLRGLLPPQPAGHTVKEVTTSLDDAGNITRQWIKTIQGKEDRAGSLLDLLPEMCEPYKGASKKVKAPKKCHKDLLCVYPMGDPHFGMYAWSEQTGTPFDLESAERNLVAAVDQLVDGAPPAEEALIVNLGDFFHTDNSSNRTSRSGAALDVDGKWGQLLVAGIRAMRRCIDRALEKHKKVTVVCEIGNHDDHSAYMFSLCLDNYYANNPRVTIDTSPAKFHWYRFGKCLFGITHGDTVKTNQLSSIMAADRPEDWGQTEHRKWFVGHVHHTSKLGDEHTGCIVETYRTLAPQDEWHRAKGYRAGQDMRCEVYHREYGWQGLNVVGIRQVWDGQ